MPKPATTPPDTRFLTGPEVARRYGVNQRMTLWRWLNDPNYADLGFPQPAFRVRDRRFWRESDLVAWERRRAAAVGHA
jgi:predicted DNA-binding transcriptional regulator AlpA